MCRISKIQLQLFRFVVIAIVTVTLVSGESFPDYSGDHWWTDIAESSRDPGLVRMLRGEEEAKPRHCRVAFCEADHASSFDRGGFDWPEAELGTRVYLRCPYALDTPVYASRDCTLRELYAPLYTEPDDGLYREPNLTFVGLDRNSSWGEVNLTMCPRSPLEELIDELQQNINGSNLVDHIDRIYSLVTKYDTQPIQPDDVTNILDITWLAINQSATDGPRLTACSLEHIFWICDFLMVDEWHISESNRYDKLIEILTYVTEMWTPRPGEDESWLVGRHVTVVASRYSREQTLHYVMDMSADNMTSPLNVTVDILSDIQEDVYVHVMYFGLIEILRPTLRPPGDSLVIFYQYYYNNVYSPAYYFPAWNYDYAYPYGYDYDYGSGDVGFDSGSGNVGYDSGSGNVGFDSGSGNVGFDSGSGNVGYDSGSGNVGFDFGSGNVGFDFGSGSVGYDSGSGNPGYDSGSVNVGFDSGSGNVGYDSGSGNVGYDSGSVNVGFDSGSGNVGYDSGSGNVGFDIGGGTAERELVGDDSGRHNVFPKDGSAGFPEPGDLDNSNGTSDFETSNNTSPIFAESGLSTTSEPFDSTHPSLLERRRRNSDDQSRSYPDTMEVHDADPSEYADDMTESGSESYPSYYASDAAGSGSESYPSYYASDAAGSGSESYPSYYASDATGSGSGDGDDDPVPSKKRMTLLSAIVYVAVTDPSRQAEIPFEPSWTRPAVVNASVTVTTPATEDPEMTTCGGIHATNLEEMSSDFSVDYWYEGECENSTDRDDLDQCSCLSLGFIGVFGLKERKRKTELTPAVKPTGKTFAEFLGFPFVYELWVTSHVLRALSLACLLATVIAYLTHRKARKGRPTVILLNLCVSLILLLLCLYVSGVVAGTRWGCRISNLLRYYLILVSVCWNGVEAFNMYLMLIRVFNSDVAGFVWKSALVAWGAPLVGVIAVVSVNAQGFDGVYDDNCRFRCELRPYVLYFAYLLPMLLIILHNVVVFGLVVRVLTRHGHARPAGKKSKHWIRLVGALAMMVLLGVPWVFSAFGSIDGEQSAVLARTEAGFQIVYVVFVNLQGVFIFLFHCVRNSDMRTAWHTTWTSLRHSSGSTNGSVRSGSLPVTARKHTNGLTN